MPMTRPPYPLTGIQDSGDGLDPQLQQLLDLIQAQQPPPGPPPVEPPPPVPGWQQALLGGTPKNFIGGLGDAISAMAAVRAGGLPPQIGAYAAGKQRKADFDRQAMLDYEQQNAAQGQRNSDFRNQAILADYERQQKLSGDKELAALKPNRANRLIPQNFVRNINGESRRISRMIDPMSGDVVPVVDPDTGEMVYERDLGIAGFAPNVMPGMVTDPGQAPRAAILNVPKGGGEATEVKGPGGARLEPPPPPGLATETGGKIGVLQGVPHLMDVFNSTDHELRGNGAKWKTVVNWASAQTAGTRFQNLVQPVAMQKYYNEMRGILTPYVRSVSGLVFPESELRRYESRMPIPGFTPPEVAATQWDSLISEMVRDIQGKYGATGRTAPPIPGGGAAAQSTTTPTDPAVQEYEDYLKSLGVGQEDVQQ